MADGEYAYTANFSTALAFSKLLNLIPQSIIVVTSKDWHLQFPSHDQA